MFYREYHPHPDLADYIKCYWQLECSPSLTREKEVIVLSEGYEFSFNLADPLEILTPDQKLIKIRRKRSPLIGPMTRPLRIRLSGKIALFGICFHPGGAYPFYPFSAKELTNTLWETDDFLESRPSKIPERIFEDCRSIEERVALLDTAFLHHRLKPRREDSSITAARNLIIKSKGQMTISRVAKLAGLGDRQLERLFWERIGMAPKQFCRNIRFKNVLKNFQTSPGDSWSATAQICGYYDQSHMINEFKYYTGESPGSYFSRLKEGGSFFTGNF